MKQKGAKKVETVARNVSGAGECQAVSQGSRCWCRMASGQVCGGESSSQLVFMSVSI